jgi:hypothetical protein
MALVIGAVSPVGLVQLTVNVWLFGAVGVAVSSVGGGGGLSSMSICSLETADSFPAASIASTLSVCAPSESVVVSSVRVCGPVAVGHGWGWV